MQIQQLKIFTDIYSTKSFVRTAEINYMTESAVSQRLKSMEKELDTKLFERTNHRVIPTESGNNLFTYAMNILFIYKEGIRRMNTKGKKFYIHTQTQNYSSPINSALLEFSYLHKDAEYQILKPFYDEILIKEQMAPKHIYLVRKSWISDPEINYFELGVPYFSVILKRGDPLAEKKNVTTDDLMKRNVLMVSPNGVSLSFRGPYLGSLRDDFDRKRINIVTSDSMQSLMGTIISGGFDSAGVTSNTPLMPQGIPLCCRHLEMSDSETIGFAYTGSATEYMLEYMNLVRRNMAEQYETSPQTDALFSGQ